MKDTKDLESNLLLMVEEMKDHGEDGRTIVSINGSLIPITTILIEAAQSLADARSLLRRQF